MIESGEIAPYDVMPFRPERNGTVDTFRWARRRLAVASLVELDITGVRGALRGYRGRTGEGLGLTAWVVSCVARAAAEHPRVHALRRGRRQLALFTAVDVAVLIERAVGGAGETLPMPYVVRDAQQKRATEIHEEIRKAQTSQLAAGRSAIEAGPGAGLQALFFRLPAWLRDLVYWRWLFRNPARLKRTMGTVVVTATGMAAPGVLAWGIPVSMHPLAIGMGGVARRDAGNGPAEVLALTVVFDHAVTDGAPVGRFIRRLQQLVRETDQLG
jgi:pyruvate/2-oxoglutarate dehydrogenase complex dihydrolipoamide acyltransferase (E2) component